MLIPIRIGIKISWIGETNGTKLTPKSSAMNKNRSLFIWT